MTPEVARVIASQFRIMAVKLTTIDSQQDIKILYQAITQFADEIAVFKHQEVQYSIHRSLRAGILDRLNHCVANCYYFQPTTAIEPEVSQFSLKISPELDSGEF